MGDQMHVDRSQCLCQLRNRLIIWGIIGFLLTFTVYFFSSRSFSGSPVLFIPVDTINDSASSSRNANNTIHKIEKIKASVTVPGSAADKDIKAARPAAAVTKADDFMASAPADDSQALSITQAFKCGGAKPDKAIEVKAKNIAGGPARTMYLYGLEFGGAKKDIVSMQIAGGSGWEKAEIDQLAWAMERPLPPGQKDTKVFVDVGANVGWFTINMAARGYHVETFEAMSINQGLIDATLCAPENKDVRARINFHRYGLGSEAKKCFVYSGDWNSGNGMTDCKSKTREEAQAKLNHPTTPNYYVRSEMEIKRLDTVLKTSIKAMKMDVEGYEPWVLDGAKDLFAQHKVWYIVLECNQPVLDIVTGLNCVDLAKQLLQLGYRLSLTAFAGPFIPVETDQGITQLKAAVNKNPYKIVNLYCSHKDLKQS